MAELNRTVRAVSSSHYQPGSIRAMNFGVIQLSAAGGPYCQGWVSHGLGITPASTQVTSEDGEAFATRQTRDSSQFLALTKKGREEDTAFATVIDWLVIV